MYQEIEVRINKKTGKFTLEAIGFQGPQCHEDLDKLMNALDGHIVTQSSKEEDVLIVGHQKVGLR